MADYADLFEAEPDAEQRRLGAFALKQFKAYKLAAGKTAKSILISCSTRLAPFAMREKYGDEDEDSIEVDDDEDEYRVYDNYDECLAPMNGNSSHEEQYPDHHGTHSPVDYDENCENGDCFYVRLNAIDLDDIKRRK